MPPYVLPLCLPVGVFQVNVPWVFSDLYLAVVRTLLKLFGWYFVFCPFDSTGLHLQYMLHEPWECNFLGGYNPAQIFSLLLPLNYFAGETCKSAVTLLATPSLLSWMTTQPTDWCVLSESDSRITLIYWTHITCLCSVRKLTAMCKQWSIGREKSRYAGVIRAKQSHKVCKRSEYTH